MVQLILVRFQVYKMLSHFEINSSISTVARTGLDQETEILLSPINAKFPENNDKI